MSRSLDASYRRLREKKLYVSKVTGEEGDGKPVMDSGPPPPEVIKALKDTAIDMESKGRKIPGDLAYVIEENPLNVDPDTLKTVTAVTNSVRELSTTRDYYQVTTGEDRGMWKELPSVSNKRETTLDKQAEEIEELKQLVRVLAKEKEEDKEKINQNKEAIEQQIIQPPRQYPTTPPPTPTPTTTTTTTTAAATQEPKSLFFPETPKEIVRTEIKEKIVEVTKPSKLDEYLENNIPIKFETTIGTLDSTVCDVVVEDTRIAITRPIGAQGFTPKPQTTLVLVHNNEKYNIYYPDSKITLNELGLEVILFLRFEEQQEQQQEQQEQQI